MKKIVMAATLVFTGICFSANANQPVDNPHELSILNKIAKQQTEQNMILKDIRQQLIYMNKKDNRSELNDNNNSQNTEDSSVSDLDKLNKKIQKNVKEQDNNLKRYQAEHAEDNSKA